MSSLIRLDLGSNNNFANGFIGVDKIDCGQDYVIDLEHQKLPFLDNTVDEIRANHFLEHLKDTINCLNECWRVLKLEGKIICVAPYGLWSGGQNPSHFQHITQTWISYLTDKKARRFGFKKWKLLSLKEDRTENGEVYTLRWEMSPDEKDKITE